MITTLIVIMMVLIYLSIFFGRCAKSTFDNGIYIVGCVLSVAGAIIMFVVVLACCFAYARASHAVVLINEKFKTNYTVDQMFYCEDIVEEICEIKRKRIELNGDLIREDLQGESL